MLEEIEKFLQEHHATRKFLHQFGWAIIGGIVVVMPGFADVITEIFPDYSYFVLPLFMAVMVPVQNWYNHRNDGEKKKK